MCRSSNSVRSCVIRSLPNAMRQVCSLLSDRNCNSHSHRRDSAAARRHCDGDCVINWDCHHYWMPMGRTELRHFPSFLSPAANPSSDAFPSECAPQRREGCAVNSRFSDALAETPNPEGFQELFVCSSAFWAFRQRATGDFRKGLNLALRQKFTVDRNLLVAGEGLSGRGLFPTCVCSLGAPSLHPPNKN